jgi:aspartate-semialdehyde dehydrogenase
MSDGYRIAIVGATGVVGNKVQRVLEERSASFPVSELVPFASRRSVGKRIRFRDKELTCRALSLDAVDGFDLVFSSAGGDVSREWAGKFADGGAIVIDKSSAFRNDPEKVPLVVPEVNPQAVHDAVDHIIASPNCSTTQLVVTLNPLHQAVKIKRLVISTYQAVSGTGQRALDELESQSRALLNEEEMPAPSVYPHPIAFNALAQAGNFLSDDSASTDEEQKLVRETRRILNDPSIQISATCVRVPVCTCHSEAVNVEFHKPLSADAARSILDEAPGLEVIDEPAEKRYPTALQAEDRDGVFVGRIRNDESHSCTLNMWIVADNLRKGAATNAVEIAELLHQDRLLDAHARRDISREPVHA